MKYEEKLKLITSAFNEMPTSASEVIGYITSMHGNTLILESVVNKINDIVSLSTYNWLASRLVYLDMYFNVSEVIKQYVNNCDLTLGIRHMHLPQIPSSTTLVQCREKSMAAKIVEVKYPHISALILYKLASEGTLS